MITALESSAMLLRSIKWNFRQSNFPGQRTASPQVLPEVPPVRLTVPIIGVRKELSPPSERALPGAHIKKGRRAIPHLPFESRARVVLSRYSDWNGLVSRKASSVCSFVPDCECPGSSIGMQESASGLACFNFPVTPVHGNPKVILFIRSIC
jgi:hypothetical protein